MKKTLGLRAVEMLGMAALVAFGVAGCRTAALSAEARSVTASRNAPPPECEPKGYLTGRGGGTFGGGLVSNEDLIEYALNDLRNQAAELGANFIQHDPPQMGSGDGTTTTVTMTGTAYQCVGAEAADAPKAAAAQPDAPSDVPPPPPAAPEEAETAP